MDNQKAEKIILRALLASTHPLKFKELAQATKLRGKMQKVMANRLAHLLEAGKIYQPTKNTFAVKKTDPVKHDLAAELRLIANELIQKAEVPVEFPKPVIQAARTQSLLPVENELQNRLDLTHIPFVTIDGEDAKDFDDAVCVTQENDQLILWVAIADVSHYVTKDQLLDREAMFRGNSIYLAHRVIPMLPHELSSGICSLKPNELRLSLVCKIIYNLHGVLQKYELFEAVIKSRFRFTYTLVEYLFSNPAERKTNCTSEIETSLLLMQKLASMLMKQKNERGALNFDIPEGHVDFDRTTQLPKNIQSRERLFSHELIEVFMLQANECVALFLHDNKIPTLYRIHEPPKAERLQPVIEGAQRLFLDITIPSHQNVKDLTKFLESITDIHIRKIIHFMFLTSLEQARYHPENCGHFGLALEWYLHFTSPIRRYPDLLVHRQVKQLLHSKKKYAGKNILPYQVKRKKALYDLEQLGKIGILCSVSERKAVDLERKIFSLYQSSFMLDKIGQEFDAHISGVTGFGVFVQIKIPFVEGMIHIKNLPSDYYYHDEKLFRLVGRTRRLQFQLGSEIRVKLQSVNLSLRRIDFVVALSDEKEKETQNERTDRTSRKRKNT